MAAPLQADTGGKRQESTREEPPVEMLVITEGLFEGACFPITADHTTIGRMAGCDIRLPDNSVSRRHARLDRNDGEMLLFDLGSMNGTYVNGKRMRAPRLLRGGDIIKIGDARLEFRQGDEPADVALSEEAQRHRNHMDVIGHFQSQVGRVTNWETVVQLLCQTAARLLDAKVQAAQEFERGKFFPFAANDSETLHPLPGAKIIRKALRTKEPVKIGEGRAFVPLVHRSSVPILGLHIVKDRFRDDDLELAALICNCAASTPAFSTSDEPGLTAAVRSPVKDKIVGKSRQRARIITETLRAATTSVPVLVLGESGTGKELVARAIHEQSSRAEKPFVAFNCASLPSDLIDSELFGHEKGAFTGANRQHPGLFEQAGEGSLFLDEVAELPLVAQAKLLRILDTGEYRRIGGTEVKRARARILCATNRDIETLMDDGEFRLDLYYRIAGHVIELPPLRDRPDDIPVLVDHFLDKYSKEAGIETPTISNEALQRLVAHHWPGNVRELEMLMRRVVHTTGSETIRVENLPKFGSRSDTETEEDTPLISLKEQERIHILRVLEECEGNKKRAAEVLGISRATLYKRLKEYDGDE